MLNARIARLAIGLLLAVIAVSLLVVVLRERPTADSQVPDARRPPITLDTAPESRRLAGTASTDDEAVPPAPAPPAANAGAERHRSPGPAAAPVSAAAPAPTPDTRGRLTGTVFAEGGLPAAGAEVLFLRQVGSDASRVASATTDAAGRYELTFTERVLGFARARWQPDDELPAAEARTPLLQVEPRRTLTMDLKLAGRYVIAGTVVDAFGSPIAAATVDTHGIGDTAWRRPFGQGHASTDADGRFRIELRRPGEHVLHAEVDGLVQAGAVSALLSRERPAAEVTIRLLQGRSIAGRVLWDDDAPVVGATVSARPLVATLEGPDLPWARRVSRQVVTGDDGRFTLAPLHPDALQLVISHGEPYTGSLSRAVVTPPGETSLLLVFERDPPPGLGITGSVIEAGTARTIAGVSWSVGPWVDGYAPPADGWVGGRIGPDIEAAFGLESWPGGLGMRGLRPGTYGLAVAAPGYEPRVLGPLQLVDEDLALAVELEPRDEAPGIDDSGR